MRLNQFLCGVAMVMASAGVASAETPLNLLFFGNSYTQGWMRYTDTYYNGFTANGVGAGGGVPGAIANFATADGHVAPRIVRELAGGQDLSYHVATATNSPSTTVANNGGSAWNYVILQDESLRPADKTSTAAAIQQFKTDTKKLSDMTRSNGSPNAGTILYNTWARGHGTPVYPTGTAPGSVYSNTYANPAAMQADLNKNYAEASADLNTAYGYAESRVAPVGAAFASLGFDSALYDPDQQHATAFGYSLSAAVLYRTIYNENISDIPYSKVSSWIGLTPAQYAQVQSTADSVAIPEPASVAAVGIGSTLLLRRRPATAAAR